MPDAHLNGIRVHYLCAGKAWRRRELTPRVGEAGSVEPVVLIHGYTGSHSMWYQQVPALAKAGYAVVAYDIRGHGESEKRGPFDLEILVEDLAALLDHLKVERAHLVGLSLGGLIVQRFALAWPGRVASLILADTFPGRIPDGPMAIFRKHARVAREKGLKRLFEHIMIHPALPFGPDFKVPLEALGAYEKAFLKNDIEALLGFMEVFEGLPDWTEELKTLAMPTLLIAGNYDLPCLEPMRRMAEVIPGASFKIIIRAGHSSAVEKAEEFNRELLAFLAK